MSDHFYYTQLARTGDRPFLIRKFMELGFTEKASNYALIISIMMMFVIAIGIVLYTYGLLNPSRVSALFNSQPASQQVLDKIRYETNDK